MTAAEITMKKTSSILRKYHNKCERHFLSLQFIIRNKKRCKRPSGFLGSRSNLPQPTTASRAAAHSPLNYLLDLHDSSELWTNGYRWYIYTFQLCIKNQTHYTLKHGSFKLKFSGFPLFSAGKTPVFSHTCEEIFPNSIRGKKYVHLSL